MPGNSWFTADLHFGHENIIRHCARPFRNADHMDAMLLDGLNEWVGANDHLYILGDFCWRSEKLESYRERIRCKNVYLVRGNHDRHVAAFAALFRMVEDLAEVHLDGHRVVLCHYPMLSWHGSHRGSWHLHGHCHGRLPEEPEALRLDVGVDAHDYRPWHWEEIKARLLPKQQEMIGAGCFPRRAGLARL